MDEERTIIYWYTYDVDGNPFLLIAQGINSGIHLTGMFIPYIRVEATAYYHEGMIYGEFDPEPEPPTLSFEFFDETDCVWSGQVSHGFIFSADWGNQCGAAAVEHSGNGIHFFEYKLCDSENECVRKDEAMIFEDDGETLIFSR